MIYSISTDGGKFFKKKLTTENKLKGGNIRYVGEEDGKAIFETLSGEKFEAQKEDWMEVGAFYQVKPK